MQTFPHVTESGRFSLGTRPIGSSYFNDISTTS